MSSLSSYSILLNSPKYTFTAQHAIRYLDGTEEELHEHQFRAIARISGPLNKAGYVLDFVLAEHCLQNILRELDQKVLLSRNQIAFSNEKTLCLPLENVTAELLAEYIGDSFIQLLGQKGAIAQKAKGAYLFSLQLEESPGMWAEWSRSVKP
ncbi:MAG: 6-pyruvoyl trahydropterin synthase family protein [Thermoguttaceae bacterium]